MSRMADVDIVLHESMDDVNGKGYCTIREIYEEMGLKCDSEKMEYDPDSWGWDKHGFRQLFDENGNFIPYEES